MTGGSSENARAVLLTGATGFVGAATLRALRARGHSVALLLRDARGRAWRIDELLAECVVIRGDLADPAGYADAVGAFAPDALVHLAWDGVAGRDRDDPRQDANVSAMESLLSVARPRALVALGSQAEYGPCAGVITEDAPERPTTRYGRAKCAAHAAARAWAERSDARLAWLRLFSSYGPGDETYWLIPSLITQLLDGARPALTRAEQRWDYVHVRDVARAVVAAVESPAAQGAFNVGSGVARPLREVITRVRDLVDPSLPLGFGEVPYRDDQVMHLEADITRLRAATGWSPREALDAGLRETVAWYRAHRGLLRA